MDLASTSSNRTHTKKRSKKHDRLPLRVRTVEPGSTDKCPNGGLKIRFPGDKRSRYICNGANGQSVFSIGPRGPEGKQGPAGLNGANGTPGQNAPPPAFAELLSAAGTPQLVPANIGLLQYNGWVAAGPTLNATTDLIGQRIVIQQTGTYRIAFDITWFSTQPGTPPLWSFQVGIDDVPDDTLLLFTSDTTNQSGGDPVANGSASGFAQLTAGQTVNLFVSVAQAGTLDDILLQTLAAHLTVQRIA